MDNLGTLATASYVSALITQQEWRHNLRSTIHPYIFAAAYGLGDALANVLHLSLSYRAELLVAVPKVLQAHIAAVGDYYTWKLGEKVYGRASLQAWAAVCLSQCPIRLEIGLDSRKVLPEVT